MSRLMTLLAPRGSSESALRFGGAVCAVTAGAAGFGVSPVIWARRSPIWSTLVYKHRHDWDEGGWETYSHVEDQRAVSWVPFWELSSLVCRKLVV